MKRKRFIKMLLSRRVPRNQAEQLAKITQELGCGYSKALGDFMLLCWIRTYNALWGGELYQTAEKNVWVGVLAHD